MAPINSLSERKKKTPSSASVFSSSDTVDLHQGPGYLRRGGMAYLPIAGTRVGLFVSVFFDVAHVTLGLPSILSATISTAASLWVTGCFQQDGLATDNASGCAVLLLYTMAKPQLLAALDVSHWECGQATGAGPALVASHTLARLTVPWLVRPTRDCMDNKTSPSYKFYMHMGQPKHLVSWFGVLFATVICFAVASVLYGQVMAAALVAAVIVAAHFSGGYGEYIFGDVMGDFLGVAICLTELLVLTIILALTTTSLQGFDVYRVIQDIIAERPDLLLTRVFHSAKSPNEPMGALARFLLVVLCTAVWYFVVRDAMVKARNTSAESNDDKLEIRFKEEFKGTSEAASSGAVTVEHMFSSPTSTFQERYDAVRLYLHLLAKPVGPLGTLEDWAARLAALQRTARPTVDATACIIFAADHGTAKDPSEGGEGCSSCPQAVTRTILDGFERGIAGASILAKQNNASLRVVDVGVAGEPYGGKVVRSSSLKLHGGTRNLCVGPAMTAEEAEGCMRAGRDAFAQHVSDSDAQAVVLGEVGVGNMTASSALIAQLTGADIKLVCGGGATVPCTADNSSIARKVHIVSKALDLHRDSISSAIDALAKLGGAEIAALVGSILEASEQDVPVLIDGFTVTAAALVAASISPSVCRVMFLTTKSAGKGQAAAVDAIQRLAKNSNVVPPGRPALDMSLRIGEASTALLSVPLLKSAAAVSLEGSRIFTQDDINSKAYDILSGKIEPPTEFSLSVPYCGTSLPHGLLLAEDLYASLHSVEFDHEMSCLPRPPEVLRKDSSNAWHYDCNTLEGERSSPISSERFSFLKDMAEKEASQCASFETEFKKFLQGGVSVRRLIPKSKSRARRTRYERRALWLMLPDMGALRLGFVSKSCDKKGAMSKKSSTESAKSSVSSLSTMGTGASEEVKLDSALSEQKDTDIENLRRGNVQLSKKHSIALTDVTLLTQDPRVRIKFKRDDHLKVISIEDIAGTSLLFLANSVREAELLVCGLKFLLERETARLGVRGGVPITFLGGTAGENAMSPAAARGFQQKPPMLTAKPKMGTQLSGYSSSEVEVDDDIDSIFTDEDSDILQSLSSSPEGRKSWGRAPGSFPSGNTPPKSKSGGLLGKINSTRSSRAKHRHALENVNNSSSKLAPEHKSSGFGLVDDMLKKCKRSNNNSDSPPSPLSPSRVLSALFGPDPSRQHSGTNKARTYNNSEMADVTADEQENYTADHNSQEPVTVEVKPLPKVPLNLLPPPREEDEENATCGSSPASRKNEKRNHNEKAIGKAVSVPHTSTVVASHAESGQGNEAIGREDQ